MTHDRPTRLVPATDADLAACAREPIHTPGAIQAHGVLIALRAPYHLITHVSANIEALAGLPPEQILGHSLAEIVGDAAADAVQNIVGGEDYVLGTVVPLELPVRDGAKCMFQVHATADTWFIEVERTSTDDDLRDVLKAAKLSFLKLRDPDSVETLCRLVVREIRHLTGYDRVMVYQFDRDGHGRVVAEARDAAIESYLDLRYPASDIPAQARQLYLLARVRIIADAAYTPVSILTWENPAAPDAPAKALDLSYCGLRSVSPIHLEYVRNMGVAATMAISIIQDQRLWGMVVCHHRTPLIPSFSARTSCDVIGQLLGLLIAEVDERTRLADLIARETSLTRIADELDRQDHLLGSLAAAGRDLLKLVGADGALVRLAGKTRTVGAVPPPDVALQILDTLRIQDNDEIFFTENLGALQPRFKDWKTEASGVLLLPFANHSGDGIIWFRGEVIRTVKWGGDPNDKALMEPLSRRISPRKSFQMWKERVEGCAVPWTAADEQAAAGLRRVVARAMLRQTEQELFRVSSSDPLTGLANRSVLNEFLQAWRQADPPAPAAVLFFDIDRFKNVNDSLGHYAGDDLLREVADRLSALAGPDHLVVRLGGDEFVIMAENISESEAWDLAQSVLRQFDHPFTVAGRPVRATTSIGLACGAAASDDLLRNADAAMYAAKRQGGGRIVRFEAKLHAAVHEKLLIEQDLFLALDRQQLSLHFQPIVYLPSAKLRGFEALVRWRHPERGWISPAEFIPLAEETGQIERIGLWVAEQAVATLAKLEDKTLRMTINVSGKQLVGGRFCEAFARILAAAAIDPPRIIIEVTESVLMEDEAVKELERMRALGCRIAIDDFGIGYSSLAYLRRLPVNVIKIDQSFISSLGHDRETELFLRALVKLIRTLRLAVIAEGVETLEQWRLLAKMHCDAAQGYFFGKPAPHCDYHPPAALA